MRKTVWLLVVLSPAGLRAQQSGVEPLADIVGTWQSDTVGGTSARSVCDWSPAQGGVICEQTITGPVGRVTHALNVFLPDAADHLFMYYGIVEPGEDVPATALDIHGHVWVYGGRRRGPDGLYHRTVNDFTAHDGSYVWRQESSPDGARWTVQRKGRAVRERSPASGSATLESRAAYLIPVGRTQRDTTRWTIERHLAGEGGGHRGLQVMVVTRGDRTTTDSVRFDPVTLTLDWEWASASPTSVVRWADSRLRGTVDTGRLRATVDLAAPGPVYSSTMDNVVIERLPLAEGYRTVLDFWDGDHLERDTIRVRESPGSRWAVEFAEPYAVERLWIDKASRRTVRHSYTWRRDGTESEVVPEP